MFKQNKDNQKNEVRNQGNRRYSMLLMALLFIGMATYGTYAYFTDSTSVNGNIQLKLGTVELGDAKTTEEWTYVGYGKDSEGKELKNAQIKFVDDDSDYSTVQPGDQFTKKVTVEYKGTLDAVVDITNNYEDENGKLTLQATVENQDGKKDADIKTVSPGEVFTVVLTATVPIEDKEIFDSGRNVDGGTTIDLTALTEAVTITATQNK